MISNTRKEQESTALDSSSAFIRDASLPSLDLRAESND